MFFTGENALIVSNRLPVSMKVNSDGSRYLSKSSGGLVSGLEKVHNQSNLIWLGYLGSKKDTSDLEFEDFLKTHKLRSLEISDDLYDKYYNGYANGILWPLFHNFLGIMSISDECFDAYSKVNQLFANEILKTSKDGDYIWIQDYQLMLLPKMLKDKNPSLKISYFHHIPFPTTEIFRVIPRRKDLLRGVLGADYIGFHTNDYVRHFLNSCQRLLGVEARANEVYHNFKSIKVGAHPLGVDFNKLAIPIEKEKNTCAIKRKYSQNKKISILGIDRLDYTKGISEKLHSFRKFLENYPEYLGKVQLTQICVPTREKILSYTEIKKEVEQLVGQINGQFGSEGYTPIQYIYRSISFQNIVKLYQNSDILLITPLRDGLNLVCKEYVASRTDDDGVLILSEFAGASCEMGEALLVNPYDVRKVANTLHLAINMEPSDRIIRMKSLRERISKNTNIDWCEKYIKSWKKYYSVDLFESKKLTTNKKMEISSYLLSKKRIFLFLDYDGSLTDIVDRPELALPSKRLLIALKLLSQNKNFSITINTGRPADFCDQYFKGLSINFVAEHGAFIKLKDEKSWHRPFSSLETMEESLLEDITNLFSMYVQSVKDSHIEKKKTCMVWHYRESDPIFAEEQATELYLNLKQLLAKTSCTPYRGKKSIEVRFTLANKGNGVEYILEKECWRKDEDALVTVGDDTTDEDMHRIHPKENLSIHIGKYNGMAKFFLDSPSNCLDLLEELIELNQDSKPPLSKFL